jgi:hypothetical protein
MKVEMFTSNQKLSAGIKRKTTGDTQPAGPLTFPAMSLDNMKRPERLDFLSKMTQWLEALSASVEHLSFVQPTFCRQIFNLQGQIQILVDKLVDLK